MGYWGTLITVRSVRETPASLQILGAKVRLGAGAVRGDGWCVYDVPGNAVGDDAELLPSLAATSGAPVLAAYIADGDYGQLVGASPSGDRWGAWLARQTAYAFECDHYRARGAPRSLARRRASQTIAGFGSPPAAAARQAVRWAADGGYSVSAGPIRQILRTARPPGLASWLWLPWRRYVFAEDIYFDLLDHLGLPRADPATN